MSQLLLTDLLTEDRIRIPLRATGKTELIAEMCAHLTRRADAIDREEAIRTAVLEREKVLSTGIGHGVAVPHGKSEALDELVLVAGVPAEPVDFEALDGQPVQLVFLMIGPQSAAGHHVKILGEISRLLRDEGVRARLVACAGAEAFHQVLRDAEAAAKGLRR